MCIALIAIVGISNARQLTRPGGYLVKTGPSPLRFQTPRGPMNLPALSEDRPVSVPAQTSTNPISEPASNIPLALPTSPTAGLLYDASTNPSQPAEPAAPVNPPTANDVPTVTPQMLADILKPGTNAARVNLFGPVYFMPPMAPWPSSSATYKIQ